MEGPLQKKKTSCRTRSAERGALKGESRDKKMNSEKQQTINIEEVGQVSDLILRLKLTAGSPPQR